MALEGFEEDEKGNCVTEVGDVRITVGVHGDNIMLEQDGDGEDPDLIMMFHKAQVEGIIQKLQTWVNAQ